MAQQQEGQVSSKTAYSIIGAVVLLVAIGLFMAFRSSPGPAADANKRLPAPDPVASSASAPAGGVVLAPGSSGASIPGSSSPSVPVNPQ